MDSSGNIREINSRGLLVRLLTYAIRCPSVARLAMQKVQPTYFDQATQLDFFMVWFVAQQMMLKSGTTPHPQHLNDLVINLMNGEGYTDPTLHAGVTRLINEVYTFKEDPWNESYGVELLNAFFHTVFKREATRSTQQATTRDEALEIVMRTHKQLNVDQNKPVDPFDLSETPTLSKRLPTGATYFDLITGGGTIPTECYGVLGPSGGGKTLMAIDVGCSMAERKQRVEYFSYEQPPREVRPRMFSRAGGIHIDELKNKEWDEIPGAVRDKIADASEKIKGNFIMHDRSAEGDSVADVIGVVRDSISSGHHPTMVVIDWLWPLVTRATAVRSTSRRNVTERAVLQSMMDEFKAMASEYNTCVLLLHQLSIEMAKRRASKKPQWFNSAEAGSFAWLLHYCIAIGTQDEQGFCYLVGSKSRSNAKTSFVVQCLGAYNKFRIPTNSMVYDDKRREFVDDQNLNRMPGRERSDPGSDEEDLKGGLV